MKVITKKQELQALHHTAELLKRDGRLQTKTVQEWLDDADLRPADFQSSQPALEILHLLGLQNEIVRVDGM